MRLDFAQHSVKESKLLPIHDGLYHRAFLIDFHFITLAVDGTQNVFTFLLIIHLTHGQQVADVPVGNDPLVIVDFPLSLTIWFCVFKKQGCHLVAILLLHQRDELVGVITIHIHADVGDVIRCLIDKQLEREMMFYGIDAGDVQQIIHHTTRGSTMKIDNKARLQRLPCCLHGVPDEEDIISQSLLLDKR